MNARLPLRPTELAHLFVRQTIRAGDWVIDATAGNGHDTLLLAKWVEATGRVLAFDVQAAAIDSTRAKVAARGWLDRVEFHQESHEALGKYAADSSVAAVMFNLGYLPGASHELVTETASTLAGLTAAADILKPGGILSVVCYPGHAGGDEEAAAVEDWFGARAANGWRVARYGALGTLRAAPFLLFGVKP
jgi:predicted methyltransferase